MKNLILDFETLALTPDACVCSVAFLVFEPSEILSFDELVNNCKRLKFNLKPQYKTRVYDNDTIKWWKLPENREAFNRVVKPSSNDIELSELFGELTEYMGDMGFEPFKNGSLVWARGTDFDIPLLYNILDQFNQDRPFPYYNVRDVRTAIDTIYPYVDEEYKNDCWTKFIPPKTFIKHVETHDIAKDVLELQHCHILFNQ